MTSTKPPGGTRDFLPDDIRRRDHVVGVIRSVYERHGFEPLETPAFENIETLLGKYGEEGNKLIFKILRRGEHERSGEADLALRYDLTVPLARVVAQYQNELPRFFKRYQIQPVWRADRPAKGRFREFYQCDIDTIGSASPLVEVEQLAAVSEVLARLGFQDFVIRLNHRQVLAALLTHAGIAPAQHAAAVVALDKLDKIGGDGVRKELGERGISERSADILVQWLTRVRGPGTPPQRGSHVGGPRRGEDRPQDLEWLQRQLGSLDAAGAAAFDNVRQILELAEQTVASGRLRFDASLARGLSYYTGAIMEAAVPDLTGSLGGGGRYDNLIGVFLGRDVPACGFSLGLERILVVMAQRQMFPAALERGPVDVLVTIWNDERAEAVRLASELRGNGVRAEVYPESEKLAKQFKYASGRHVPFVAIVGDDERARNEVAIKDLRSGEQTRVSRSRVSAAILERLGQS